MQKTDTKKEKIDQLSEMIKSGIENLRTSDDYKKFLMIVSKFPSYSYRNTLLIALQTNGEATIVMGYKSWNTVGRHVKKNAQAIKILAPQFYKKEKEVDILDEQGFPIVDAEGKSKKAKMIEMVPSFKIISVFDYKDTEGEELPGITKRLEGTVDGYEKLLQAIIQASPAEISFTSIPGKANGVYHINSNTIEIEESLSNKHKIHTMLHEMAHAELHLNGMDKGKAYNIGEIEAESISFVTMNYLLGECISPEDVGQYTFGYVEGYSSDERFTGLTEVLPVIQKTSFEMITKIDMALEKLTLDKDISKEEKIETEAIQTNQTKRKSECGEQKRAKSLHR